MTDHCFISYSTIDALEFARKLATELEGGDDKYIDAWFDKRNLKAGIDWRVQLPEAIRECKVLLFVMSKDSIEPQSMTNEEWAFALKYKKPIIPLRLHADTDLPFGFGRRQWIDFTGEFEHGLAQLRKRLADLDSPKGQLQLLRDRLADAERDLKRAIAEDEDRIKAEIEQLKNDIKQQEVVVKSPDYAEKRTRKNISAGLLEEQRSEEIKSETPGTKFVNPIPLIAPNYFQGRLPELSQISNFLKNDHQRILTVIGRGGGGKTALSCYLLKSLEAGMLPENLGEFRVGGIVYLSEIGSHKVSFANIYFGLIQLLPHEIANKLDTLYRQPKISAVEKTRQLLESFQQEKTIVLLDNFELFVETETENLNDIELKEFLEIILRAPQHSIKIIITTRVPARDLALIEPSRHNNLHLEEGLKSPYAENILRAMDEDGRAGFKDASDEQLGRARELTLGYPRALESLYAIISVDRYTSIEELLAVDIPGTVVENLVGEAYSRLDITAQKVMQALAVFNRPVPPAAIDFLLQFHVLGINSSPILNRLVSMHFARREAGRFYLHPVDRKYAFDHVVEGEKNPHFGKGARSRKWSRNALLLRAADYYVEARKAENETKKLEDLSAQLSEFDICCIAGGYERALKVLLDIDDDFLFIWGHYNLLLDMYLRVKDKIQEVELQLAFFNGMGAGYGKIGKLSDNLDILNQGLTLAQESGNSEYENIFLSNLAGCYSDLGEINKSINLYEQALAVSQKLGRRDGERYNYIGVGLGYADAGETTKAIEYYTKALNISTKESNFSSEAILLEDLGDAWLDLGDVDKAIDYYDQAIRLANKINYSETKIYARWGLAQAYLAKNDVSHAYAIANETLDYDLPTINHNLSTLQGIIALQQNDILTAQTLFRKAVAQADIVLQNTPSFYEALDAKGLALSGLCLIEDKNQIILAKDAFHSARKITANAAGIIKRTLRLFDEIVKADTDGVLLEVRLVIEGK